MLTFKEIKNQWRTLWPRYNNPEGNIFFEVNKYFLSGFELIKSPHKIKEYSIYYQIYSLFTPLESFKTLGPIINYNIRNTKNMRFKVSLEQSKEEHYHLIKSNLLAIEKQFIFYELNKNNYHADDILIKLNGFLESSIYDENRIPIYTFMIQLSQFANDVTIGKDIFDGFINKISEYNVLGLYYSKAYNTNKEGYIRSLRDTPHKKNELEKVLYNNHLLLEGINLKRKI